MTKKNTTDNGSTDLPEEKKSVEVTGESTQQKPEDTTQQEEVLDKPIKEKSEEEKKEELPQGDGDGGTIKIKVPTKQVTKPEESNDQKGPIDPEQQELGALPNFTNEELVQKEKVKLLTIISHTCNVLAEVLKDFVHIKGGKVEATGNVLPDFESEYVKQTIISLKESSEWSKLLMKSFDEKLFPNPNELDFASIRNTIVDLLNTERDVLFSNLSSIAKGMIEHISNTDVSANGREAAIYRTNLFSTLYRVFFLFGFEETHTKEYKEFFNSLNGTMDGTQE